MGEPLGPRQPLALGAVPIAARVVGDAGRPAVLAALDMAAERRGAARLHGGHDTALGLRQMTALGRAESLSVAAEDVRYLERLAHPRGLIGRDHREREAVEWARRTSTQVRGDLRIARGRGQIDVPEQHLDDPDVGSALQEMGGEAVPQNSA